MRNLIIGIGNLLLGDEGAGVHAARALRQVALPADTTLIEIGTAILEALPYLEEATRVILLYAVKGGLPPGTVYSMPLEGFRGKESIASLHGLDFFSVMALARRERPPEAWVIGVEPARIEWRLDLSPEVAAAIPILAREVEERCWAPSWHRLRCQGRACPPIP